MMKKTLLALAVVAGTMSAAHAGVTVYDSNGISVDVKGASEVQLFKGYNDRNPAFRLDDGDLAASTVIQLNDDVSAIAGIAFRFENSDVGNDELWVGFKSNKFGELTLGRQLLVTDDAGIGKDYELGTGGVDFMQTQGDQVYKYRYDNGNLYFGTSGLIRSDSGSTFLKNSTQGGEVSTANSEIYDFNLGYRIGDFDGRAFFYEGRNIATSSFVGISGPDGRSLPVDFVGYSFEVEYQVTDAIGVSGSFSDLRYEVGETASSEGDLSGATQDALVYQIAADYKIGNTTFATGYNFWDDTEITSTNIAGVTKKRKDRDAQTYYVNVTQQLHSNVRVYMEVGYADLDEGTQEDVGYVAGMEVAF